MFNVNRFLTRSQKFILEQNFKSYLNGSVNKFNKLAIQINEDAKTKKAMENILYGNENKNALIKSQNDLINNVKFNNFFFIVSFVSIGALIFYKSK